MIKESNPYILVVTETRIGGDRAKEITDRLSFDGTIHIDTIGYAGGLWVLWNSAAVEVSHIASTEQEIHATIKVSSVKAHATDGRVTDMVHAASDKAAGKRPIG
uniref:Uncharacterized protein n=1 Tax=Quercus lobata TaxID=97700 RepID=A0A7N2LRJ8_QUELO